MMKQCIFNSYCILYKKEKEPLIKSIKQFRSVEEVNNIIDSNPLFRKNNGLAMFNITSKAWVLLYIGYSEEFVMDVILHYLVHLPIKEFGAFVQ